MALRTELRAALWSIYQGEDARSPEASDSVCVREDGMLSIVGVLTVFVFVILAALVANVGTAINQKIEMQNAADAIATSCSLQRARTLNAVTAANHLTGELLALVVLHEAIGGDDANGVQDTSAFDNTLQTQQMALQPLMITASDLKPDMPAYKDVSQQVSAVYTLLDSYKSLKDNLSLVYDVKITALGLYSAGKLIEVPPPGPILMGVGAALYYLADAVERWILMEWKILKGLESFAQKTAGARAKLLRAVPGIRRFQDHLLQQTPQMLMQTAKGLGQENHVDPAVFPQQPSLTLQGETPAMDIDINQIETTLWNNPGVEARSPPDFSRSQVVRAAYPWVNYHRQPFFQLAQLLVFSEASRHYRNWTTRITLTRCARYYQDPGNQLYVIAGMLGPNKGFESWAMNRQQAEQRFTLMGFAHRNPPERWGIGFFPKTNPDGVFAFAQSMIYNANNQNPGSGDKRFQPEVGWDTLNWQSPVGGSNAIEWPIFSRRTGCPKVRLNWQAKLVPVSRLEEAVNELAPPFRPLRTRLPSSSPLGHSH